MRFGSAGLFGSSGTCPLKRFSRVLLLLAAAQGLPASGAVALETLPTGRDDSVLGAFQSQCLREEPDYDRLETEAGTLGMADLGDHSAPAPDGGTAKSHRWGGKLPDGPFALYVSRLPTKGAVETSCGVSGMVPSAEHFREGLVHRMALPPLPVPTFDASGSAIYIWPAFPLPGNRLILQTRTGKHGEGFVLITVAVKRAS